MRLDDLAARLDSYFGVGALAADPSFSRMLPMTCDAAGFDWKAAFEPGFVARCNGLMIRGRPEIGAVSASAFPSNEVLEAFLRDAAPGDLLFLHHPLDMRCGDPRGAWGRGFVPIDAAAIRRIRDAGLSVYACHAPLDVHPEVGTASAMVEALGGSPCGRFFPYGNGYAGILCDLAPLSSAELASNCLGIFGIPYADVAGAGRDRVSRVAVVGGCGDSATAMDEAAAAGAQAYLTGEIRARVDNEFGRRRFAEMEAYASRTPLALIGVSHAASEQLVMRTQFRRWMRAEFGVEVRVIEESRWWR